ncbi:hypothetical protein MRX96_026907 [Rhipicephalus microplus]
MFVVGPPLRSLSRSAQTNRHPLAAPVEGGFAQQCGCCREILLAPGRARERGSSVLVVSSKKAKKLRPSCPAGQPALIGADLFRRRRRHRAIAYWVLRPPHNGDKSPPPPPRSRTHVRTLAQRSPKAAWGKGVATLNGSRHAERGHR